MQSVRDTWRTAGAWAFFALAYRLALAETVRLAQDGRATIGAVVLVLSIGAQLSAQLNELAYCIAWFVRTHRAVSRLVWFGEYAGTAREAVTLAGPGGVPGWLETGLMLVEVGIGDLPDAQSDPHVLAALGRAAAAELPGELPAGLETQLGREFDGGADLSLGQWQKVALARAMMRPAPLLLGLDEPTASLDAPTEHSLFERFAAAAGEAAATSGAITILVSHRFSTVRMADLILVVSDGRISESGTHDQLI